MGPSPRGGAYTYDWIENLLGLDMHGAERMLPEFQHPEVGDTIGLGANVMRLELVEPPRAIAWRSQDGNWVWQFAVAAIRRPITADQPQPLPPAHAAGQDRDAADGARVARHGAAHAGGDRAPGGSDGR